MRNREHRSASWAASLEDALRGVLPDTGPEVRLLGLSAGGTRAEIVLRFAAGRRFCCVEPGCHVSTFSRDWWARFREELGLIDDRRLPPMRFVVHGVVERGVLVGDEHGAGWRAIERAFEFTVRADERDAR